MRRWDFKLSELCEHVRLPQGQLLEDFTCGDTDIDDFFRKESLLYEKELLSSLTVFLTIERIASSVHFPCQTTVSRHLY